MLYRFINELAMQLWLENELSNVDGIADLISNIDDLENFIPINKYEKIVKNSFDHCIKHLYITTILSADKNISIDQTESLRPDLILYGEEYESLIIVELKNISQPTRQAGTELSAYSCELRSYMPFLSEADLVHIIIAVDYPTLLRHYIFHDIYWSGKKILCLMPWQNIDGTLSLSIVNIRELLNINLTLPYSNIVGYQLCLYDNSLYTNDPKPYLFDHYVGQMQIAMAAMAQEGERLNSHGFAFLWKDKFCYPNGNILAPYSISIFNLAPFKSISHQNFLQQTDFLKKIEKVIVDSDPSGHSDTISLITNRAISFLNNFSNPLPEGFLDYEYLAPMMLSRAEPIISFVSWGVFGEIYYEMMENAIKSGIAVTHNDPKVGLQVVNSVLNNSAI